MNNLRFFLWKWSLFSFITNQYKFTNELSFRFESGIFMIKTLKQGKHFFHLSPSFLYNKPVLIYKCGIYLLSNIVLLEHFSISAAFQPAILLFTLIHLMKCIHENSNSSNHRYRAYSKIGRTIACTCRKLQSSWTFNVLQRNPFLEQSFHISCTFSK